MEQAPAWVISPLHPCGDESPPPQDTVILAHWPDVANDTLGGDLAHNSMAILRVDPHGCHDPISVRDRQLVAKLHILVRQVLQA